MPSTFLHAGWKSAVVLAVLVCAAALTSSVGASPAANGTAIGLATDEAPPDGSAALDLEWNGAEASTSASVVEDGRPSDGSVTETLRVNVTNGPVRLGPDASVRLRVRNVDARETVTFTPTTDAETYDVVGIRLDPVAASTIGRVGVRTRPSADGDASASVAVSTGGDDVFDDGAFDRYVFELVDRNGTVLAATAPRPHGVDVGVTDVDVDGSKLVVDVTASVPEGLHVLLRQPGRDLTVEMDRTRGGRSLVASLGETAFDPDAPFEVEVYQNRTAVATPANPVVQLDFRNATRAGHPREEGDDGGDDETPQSSTVTVGVVPSNATVSVDGRRTLEVVVGNADDGIDAVDLTLQSSDPDVARIVDVAFAGNAPPALQYVRFAADNSSVEVSEAFTGVRGQPEATVLVVTVAGVAPGEATLSVDSDASLEVVDPDGNDYSVSVGTDSILAVRPGGPVVASAPATDPDGDGLYEDVDGDGRVGVGDVVALFEHLDEDPVRENAEAFDFTADGAVGVGDVVRLFEGL